MPWIDARNVALLTDLYELTMAAAYHARGMDQTATFDLFIRELPEKRNFLVVCGLDQALEYLEGLRFDDDALSYLESQGFDPSFLEYLGGLSFSGDVWAIPEGEIAFQGEPLLRVTAPLIEAQIVETFLINCVTFQTMIASKAARVAIACDGRSFIDFSPRRDHGADAALNGARAAYIGGASGTSNVLAGKVYGLPISGTMAHSYVMAFATETDAFRSYMEAFPDKAVLLIDTFDVEEGARRAAKVARELAPHGAKLVGVRIDSGDLAELARSVRKILDDAGFEETQIFASGDLDEYRIQELLRQGVPVDAFGVGTQLGTSGDAPSLGGVYKLVEDESGPKIKLSTGKVTLPGRKQVYRFSSTEGPTKDVIALHDEEISGGRPLLVEVMKEGRQVAPEESLEEIRERAHESVEGLPEPLRSLDSSASYRVDRSPGIEQLCERMIPRLKGAASRADS